MTIFTKDTRYGIEQSVYLIQDILESELTWSGNVNIYGLLFKNKDNDGNTILEAWVNKGVNKREYRQVFNDDKLTATIGFIETDRDIINYRVTIDVIFTINLEKAYNQKVRDNERAYIEAHRAIEKAHQVTDFKRGIDDVFAGYRTDNIQFLDMQPFDVFSFTIEVPYNNTTCQ